MSINPTSREIDRTHNINCFVSNTIRSKELGKEFHRLLKDPNLVNERRLNFYSRSTRENKFYSPPVLFIDFSNITADLFDVFNLARLRKLSKFNFKHICLGKLYKTFDLLKKEKQEQNEIIDNLLDLIRKTNEYFTTIFPQGEEVNSFVFDGEFISSFYQLLQSDRSGEIRTEIKKLFRTLNVDNAERIKFQPPHDDTAYGTFNFVNDFNQMLTNPKNVDNIREICIRSMSGPVPGLSTNQVSLEKFTNTSKLGFNDLNCLLKIKKFPPNVSRIHYDGEDFPAIPDHIREQIREIHLENPKVIDRHLEESERIVLPNVTFCSVGETSYATGARSRCGLFNPLNALVSHFPNLRQLDTVIIRDEDSTVHKKIDTFSCSYFPPELDIATRLPNLKRLELRQISLNSEEKIDCLIEFLETLEKCDNLDQLIIGGELTHKEEVDNFLDYLKSEMIAVFKKFKNPPSIALYCGINFPEEFKRSLTENLPNIRFGFDNASVKFDHQTRFTKKPQEA